jgi:hypothetical protein
MAAVQPGMKKRQIIANSNRTMFFWIAAMSALIGVCAVLSMFFIQQIIFKTKVTNKLDSTVSVLKNNNKNAQSLIENVRVLETNAALNSIKARPEDKALQVILDALPADNNALALGSSLQKNLLVLPGVTIESLAIQSVGGSDDTETSDTTIPFTMTVSATDANTLKDMLARLERSIRVIDIDTLTLERTEGKYTMTVSAHAYYEPAVTVQLKDEVVKSK